MRYNETQSLAKNHVFTEGANSTLEILKLCFNSMQKKDQKSKLHLIGWESFTHVFRNLTHLTLFNANIQKESFFSDILMKMPLR